MSQPGITSQASRIAAFISDLGPARKVLLSKGLEVLTRISVERQSSLLAEVGPYIDQVGLFTKSKADHFPESYDDLIDFITSTSTLLSFLRAEETVDDVVAAVENALTTTPATLGSVRNFLHILESHRTHLDIEKEKDDLAQSTLPSLDGSSFSVDLRVRITDEAVKLHVPVVIAYLSTDVTDQVIWFQMSRAQLAKLKQDVDLAYKKLEVLEGWAKTRD